MKDLFISFSNSTDLSTSVFTSLIPDKFESAKKVPFALLTNGITLTPNKAGVSASLSFDFTITADKLLSSGAITDLQENLNYFKL